MKSVLMRAAAIQLIPLALGFPAAQAQEEPDDLISNLAWQPWGKVSLGPVGQNLIRTLHQEYNGSDLTVLPSLVRRSAYARLTWRF
jgi:hypothetical protein